ncbi:MAG: SulP family inorganic anion transporter [Bryobacteraceae bacterium]|nr:SulP family inorganic anion transporter [Bryobacteraceae bacterium]
MNKYSNDILASIVVFLVALPLCMGISIASGVPPALGLITGIIGGIIVGVLSGAPLQVSGPAAGLTVLVFEIVRDHGIESLGPILIIAGAIQVVAGRIHVGAWFRAMSPAVVFGMLAGIGVLIFVSQFHVMLDDKPKASGLANLISIPAAIFGGIFPIDGSSHELAALMGLLTIIILIAWDKLKRGKLKLIPGALIGVVAASVMAAIFGFPGKYVDVPANLLDVVRLPGPASLTLLSDSAIWLSALALAFIASAETLLSANAVDRMQNLVKTDYDRELSAQGIGNMLCGLVGALPMTCVIVRSSANVQAGARTRLSTILHGIWLLAFVALLPFVLRMIPTSSLGAILVYTGYKLIDLKSIKRLQTYGWMPVAIYGITVVTIVATDLLTGVLTGIALTVLKMVYKMSHLQITKVQEINTVYVGLTGAATFIRMPKLAKVLEEIPKGTHVVLSIENLAYIDHACLDLLREWKCQHEESGGTLNVGWDQLIQRYAPLSKSPALQVREEEGPGSQEEPATVNRGN